LLQGRLQHEELVGSQTDAQNETNNAGYEQIKLSTFKSVPHHFSLVSKDDAGDSKSKSRDISGLGESHDQVDGADQQANIQKGGDLSGD